LKVIESRARIAGVFGHERGQRGGPAGGLLAGARVRPAMPLQGPDYGLSGRVESTIGGPEMAFVFVGIGLAGNKQIAGTRPYQQVGYCPCIRQEIQQRVPLGLGRQVSAEPSGQHRAHLAEGEWTGDVKEVAHRRVTGLAAGV
jgi:hypothetical protein